LCGIFTFFILAIFLIFFIMVGLLEWRNGLLTFFQEEYHVEEIIFIDEHSAGISLCVAGGGYAQGALPVLSG
jgi:hypothetical protein